MGTRAFGPFPPTWRDSIFPLKIPTRPLSRATGALLSTRQEGWPSKMVAETASCEAAALTSQEGVRQWRSRRGDAVTVTVVNVRNC